MTLVSSRARAMVRALPLLLAIVLPAVGSAQPMTLVEVMVGAGGNAAHQEMLRLAAQGFSGAVIAEQDGRIVLKAGYGLANRERKIPFTASTIAQLGSITKSFTATAIADLERRGLLRFSDSISSYLPGLPPHTARLTIHQLLTHSSGMIGECGGDFDRVARDEWVRDCLGRPLANEPGAVWSYSNAGYSVLGAIVERVSGTSLESYLADRFFAPIGLSRIGYLFSGAPRDSIAVGYLRDTSRGIISDRIAALQGAYWNLKGNGGMQASVNDVYRWYLEMRDGRRVITDRMRKAMFAPHVQRSEGIYYGYGWFVHAGPDSVVRQVSHSGSDGVFFAAFMWRPVDRLFVYAVSNSGENDLSRGVVGRLRGVLTRE